MADASRKRRGVFLDRDGVLNVSPPEGDYVRRSEALALTPGAGRAVRRLNAAGLVVVVCTNQRGVALGLMSTDDLDAVHERLRRLLAADGARLDGIYACTHGVDADCDCRKPRTGLFERAVREHDIDVAASFVVGDTARDVEAARALGCRAVLVTDSDLPDVGEWRRVRTLETAVDLILMAANDRPGSEPSS